MRRYLIVANRTLGGQQLLEEVRGRQQKGPATFLVLVPVSDDGLRRSRATRQAEERLDVELHRLRDIGAEVTGQLVDGDPVTRIQQLHAESPFDEIIVCTLPRGVSQWLRADLPRRVRQSVDVPVLHIVAPAGIPARITSKAVRVSIYIGESDRVGHRPLYNEIVQRARRAGLAGATVLRGIEGFGASSVVHTTRLLTMSEDLPVVVVIVDDPERIEAFLPQLDDLITEGLVVREDVDIVTYRGRADRSSS